ncbi:MAG: hypothetical protein LC749_12745 [Actinobacteria bacterium]|nr:hypothetical protein [Actinomycetota bacterium]
MGRDVGRDVPLRVVLGQTTSKGGAKAGRVDSRRVVEEPAEMCLRFRALLELAQRRALLQFALGDQHTDDAVLEVEPKASVGATPHRHRSCVLVTDTHVPLTRQPPCIWFWTGSGVGQANDLSDSAVAGQSEDALAELVLLAPAAPIERSIRENRPTR